MPLCSYGHPPCPVRCGRPGLNAEQMACRGACWPRLMSASDVYTSQVLYCESGARPRRQVCRRRGGSSLAGAHYLLASPTRAAGESSCSPPWVRALLTPFQARPSAAAVRRSSTLPQPAARHIGAASAIGHGRPARRLFDGHDAQGNELSMRTLLTTEVI